MTRWSVLAREALALRSADSCRFGRAKEATKTSAPSSRSECRMSARVRASAVAGKQLGQPAQVAVVGAEVVAPLADAVGLVDGDQAERQFGQPVQHGAGGQALGRDVEQVQLARPRRAPDGRALVQRHAGVEPRGGHALLLQRLDLIGHQGDQRRDYQAQAAPQDGGNLVADALAAAGRQHRQHVAPGQNGLDHRLLKAAEAAVAPDARQQGAGVRQARLIGQGRAGRRGGHPRLVRDLFRGAKAPDGKFPQRIPSRERRRDRQTLGRPSIRKNTRVCVNSHLPSAT